MEFTPPLIKGTLIKRYKRFLADVLLESGEIVVAHCPNTGGMLGCQAPNTVVWLRYAPSPKRKLDYSWELVCLDETQWVGIYSARANDLVEEAFLNGRISELANYGEFKREVRYLNSRLDFCFFGAETSPETKCYVEVKSVTASNEQSVALFPDAKTQRGVKHLRDLMVLKQQGHRVVLFFCVQRTGIHSMRIAPEFDSNYSDTFEEALEAGVEILAYRCHINQHGIVIDQSIPLMV